MLILGGIGRRKAKNKKNTLIEAGEIDSFSCGETYFFQSGRFFLHRYADGGFLAMSAKCTHLSCALAKQNKSFHCPCHASQFDEYGEVISPPATRPLDIFRIIEDGNLLYVDISTPIKRARFETSQLSYF